MPPSLDLSKVLAVVTAIATAILFAHAQLTAAGAHLPAWVAGVVALAYLFTQKPGAKPAAPPDASTTASAPKDGPSS